jgi:signal transduction histidine kinase
MTHSPEQNQPTGAGNAPSSAAPPAGNVARRTLTHTGRWTDHFLFPECFADAELGRRGRLISRFGLLGLLFGTLFAVFYVLIGHHWGAFIVIVCSAGFGLTPLLMKATRSLNFAGNLLAAIMTAGFAALCCVEGGLSGHAIAWLAIVPLCALLLTGTQSAAWWLLICFATAGTIISLNLAGVVFPETYPARWHDVVSATGYLALILFMFSLGMIFETSRARAFRQLQEALDKLETSNAELVRLNQEKNDFLGIAAHDLKNPLTTIILGAEMMAGTHPSPKHQAVIEGIIRSGRRMRDLISNLLDANAIEQGRFLSRPERCDLAELVSQCVANNQPLAARKNIQLVFSRNGALPVRADRNATVQILDNLVSNAVKYSPFETTVHIRSFVSDAQGFVSVIDQGPGISEADQKKLFGKFTRLSARPTGGESSNGLGLSIVKKLAEAMNGSVHCTSTLGAGATFTLSLPAWRDDPADTRAA